MIFQLVAPTFAVRLSAVSVEIERTAVLTSTFPVVQSVSAVSRQRVCGGW